MRFLEIRITGGQADSADPRSAPGSVPEALLIEVPVTLTGTDVPPSKILLTLEGTAAQTVDVTPYALAETKASPFEAQPALTERRFYKMAASAVTVTVGELTSTPAMPGKVYLRLTTAPAADAVLRVSFG